MDAQGCFLGCCKVAATFENAPDLIMELKDNSCKVFGKHPDSSSISSPRAQWLEEETRERLEQATFVPWSCLSWLLATLRCWRCAICSHRVFSSLLASNWLLPRAPCGPPLVAPPESHNSSGWKEGLKCLCTQLHNWLSLVAVRKPCLALFVPNLGFLHCLSSAMCIAIF